MSGVRFAWYKINVDYADWNVYQEMGVISAGPLSNSALFLFLMAVQHLCNKYIFCFPIYFCKIMAWYGLLTVMDFIFICIVDAAWMDQGGDLWRLYNYYAQTESSGMVGLFITFLI